jgi:hypothetical protein
LPYPFKRAKRLEIHQFSIPYGEHAAIFFPVHGALPPDIIFIFGTGFDDIPVAIVAVAILPILLFCACHHLEVSGLRIDRTRYKHLYWGHRWRQAEKVAQKEHCATLEWVENEARIYFPHYEKVAQKEHCATLEWVENEARIYFPHYEKDKSF